MQLVLTFLQVNPGACTSFRTFLLYPHAEMSCLPDRCLLCLQPGDNVLKQQLQKLQEKGPSAWQVYYDDTAAGKASKALFDSWEEFEEHVVHTHLVRPGV